VPRSADRNKSDSHRFNLVVIFGCLPLPQSTASLITKTSKDDDLFPDTPLRIANAKKASPSHGKHGRSS